MEKLKRALAGFAACAVTASAAGCTSSTDYCITANGEKINVGIYINFLLNEMTNQMYTMYYNGTVTDLSECFDQEIDGVDFKTYVKEAAMDDVKNLAAVEAKFDELELTLSDEDQEELDESVASAWESEEYYEYEGISEESLTRCYEYSYKYQAIFDYYYAEGGIEEVEESEIEDFLSENYIRYKLISIAKSTEEDEDTAEEEDAASLALFEGYLEEAQSLTFEEFDTIIDEYDAYQEEIEAEEEEDEESDEDSSDDSSEEDSSSDSEEDSSSEDESEETSEGDTSSEDESEETSVASADEESSDEDSDESDTSSEDESSEDSSEDDSSSDEDSSEDSDEDSDSDDEDSEDEDEEEDEYANESMLNYSDYVDEDSDYYDEDYAAMIDEMLSADYGEATIYEDDDYYYLFVTADVLEREDYIEDNKDTLLDEMKGEDFEDLLADWVDAMDISENTKATKKYTVQKVYDRQEEYYDE